MELAIGLMSGTSLDGVDAVLVKTDGENQTGYLEGVYEPYTKDFKELLLKVTKEDVPINVLLRIEKMLTEIHADAVNKLLEKCNLSPEDITVCGFHGQTIRHLPDEGITCQLGDASLLAELTDIPVVADFRRRDMAAGGQGAPLIPLYHRSLFEKQAKPMAVLNIGGVANITYFGSDGEVIAGDTGPGMGLINLLAQNFTEYDYDKDGMLAEHGTPDKEFVEGILEGISYFSKPLPKSADRHDFDSITTDYLIPIDAAATLCYLTIKAVIDSLQTLPEMPKKLWVTGGGSQHPTIMRYFKEYMNIDVALVDDLGLRHDYMEAECFAWLAVRRLKGLPFTLKSTTGADRDTVGGVLTY